ncbi:MAG: hypothetical protein WKG32_03065 [Gemmatimonadaceae bacterium]
MSEEALARALGGLGLVATVEAHGGIAVLRTPDASSLADGTVREAVLALARAHGFRGAALEIADAGAPVRRD